ncbi:GGDEF domain-containing protein [Hydrogenimonas urashimensis]|uniref:GGDEF domain-containing protein n=1 Tax=Hydrogenimonas urashimensis TaxID=2740515 RepID=UPI0019151998|nr:GGDEF domain-containing protein [Hydrogenimonas urashimensis]
MKKIRKTIEQKLKNSLPFHWLQEDEALLQKKLDDHRAFASRLFLLGTLIGSGLWVWDYVIDPVGAVQTVWLRLVFFVFLPVPWLFQNIRNFRFLSSLLIGVILVTEVAFVKILTHLHMGMVYGIGGFMYYMLLPPLALQPFSLRSNIVFILMAALVPHLVALAGWAPGFEHLNYAVLIWPAAFLAIIIQYFYANEYKKRYELEKRLQKMSYTDTLSGLYNRRYFMRYMEKEWQRFQRGGEPFSLLMIDIDHFKKINDTYGHPTGDVVIQKVAKLLRREIREMDFAARIGGEEFAVILPDTDEQKAVEVAERIRQQAECRRFTVTGKEKIDFRLSVGIAIAQNGDDISQLMRASDQALYEAKKRGRNRVCFYSDGVICPIKKSA